MKKSGLIMPNKGLFYGYVAPLLTIILFVILMAIAILNVYYRSKVTDGELIASDIAALVTVLENIDKECNILGFDSRKTAINFLTIKKGGFIGSQIGSMNVRNPERWNGPYLPANPEMQGIPYQIVHTKHGYFITPGEGVKLPSGTIVGKDLVFKENSDIKSMMFNGQPLYFNNKPLAASLAIGGLAQQIAHRILQN